MLLAEDCLTSILAMLIGLPVAVVLSEIVSLVTAKLVGGEPIRPGGGGAAKRIGYDQGGTDAAGGIQIGRAHV